MECPNCRNTQIITFFIEVVPCAHCKEENEVKYNVCQNCNMVWKSVGEEPLSGMVFEDSEITTMMDDGFYNFLNTLSDSDGVPGSMSEMVHKCLKCKTTAFEIEPGLFHCPECGFEWETL